MRSYFQNSCFVFHRGIQTPRNNKSTRPTASWVHLFLGVSIPWWNTRSRFGNSTYHSLHGMTGILNRNIWSNGKSPVWTPNLCERPKMPGLKAVFNVVYGTSTIPFNPIMTIFRTLGQHRLSPIQWRQFYVNPAGMPDPPPPSLGNTIDRCIRGM